VSSKFAKIDFWADFKMTKNGPKIAQNGLKSVKKLPIIKEFFSAIFNFFLKYLKNNMAKTLNNFKLFEKG